MPTETKTAKPAKPAAAASAFDAFGVAAPAAEMRDIAEKSIAQMRDGYARMKDAADEATGVAENTYETARRGAFAIGAKALDVVQANSDASFAFARELFGARTFADVVELQASFARKQLDAIGTHVKELQELSQKVVADTLKPVNAQVEKTLKEIKAA